jgi:hypothetical protein
LQFEPDVATDGPDWSRPGVLQQGLQEVEGLPREVLVERLAVDLLGGLPPSVVGGGGGRDCLCGRVFPLQPEGLVYPNKSL